ncbi:hypothetical protein KAJ41_00185 [Candidatus Parcubacteria bacterium]|nr:hypothetical protein [Candidatus Parcubacteria bacterium]
MITKTYLDGKLNQLEGSLQRRIESKDNFQTEEINKKIADLRNDVDLIGERVIENRDLLDHYLVEHNGLKKRMETLELMFEKANKDNDDKDIDKDNDKNDSNNSEQITDDLQ